MQLRMACPDEGRRLLDDSSRVHPMMVRHCNWTRLPVKATRESLQEIQRAIDWYPRDATLLILVVVVSMDLKGGADNAGILQLSMEVFSSRDGNGLREPLNMLVMPPARSSIPVAIAKHCFAVSDPRIENLNEDFDSHDQI